MMADRVCQRVVDQVASRNFIRTCLQGAPPPRELHESKKISYKFQVATWAECHLSCLVLALNAILTPS